MSESRRTRRSVNDSKSIHSVEETSKSVTSTGTDRIPGKVIVEGQLALTEAYWWWFSRIVKQYDLSLCQQLEITTDEAMGQAIYGSVLVFGHLISHPGLGFPTKDSQKLYHIRGRVPGPFPSVHTHRYGSFRLADQEEAIVWILSHEVCHFLKRTKQLSGRNTERDACSFADEWLNRFRVEREALPCL